MKTESKREVQTYRDLFSLFRLYPWAMPVIITMGVLASLSEGLGISLFIPFLQGLEQPSLQPTSGIWLSDVLARVFSHFTPGRRLLVIAVCIFGSILLKAILTFSTSALFGWLSMHITHDLRSKIFRRLLNVEYAFLEKSPSGKLFNTLATETWRSSDAMTTLVELIVTICMIGAYAALLLLISWKLTLLVLAFMGLVSMVIRYLTRRVKQIGSDLTESNAMLSKRMVQALDGMKVIRAFGRESYEKTRFDKVSARISRLVMRLMVASGLVNPVYEVLAGGLLIFVLFTTVQVSSGMTSLLVFIFVLYRLQPKVKEFDEQRVQISSSAASVEDVMSLMKHMGHPSTVSGETPISMKTCINGLQKGVRFENVGFIYDNMEKPALDNVSIFITSGKTTALVGPSGAGKSTLVKLILRLYDPTAGNLFVDDYPLKELDLPAWRNCIALVSQDVYLFDATVKENIAYGRLEATEKEIVEAARKADAHEFISQLPNEYDTEIGARGVRLSGGQQQRVSMARAFLRKPEILILDEPTSVLDTVSEHLIQDALENLNRRCTVIIIAHRLSTIRQADHIIVLDEGRISEQGNLQDLLAHRGLFAKLYDLQFPNQTT